MLVVLGGAWRCSVRGSCFFSAAWRCVVALGGAWWRLAVLCDWIMLRGGERMALLRNAPRCVVVLGAAWRCLALLGAAWRCLALLGAAWRCLALLGAAWRYLALLGGAGGS